MHPTDADVLEPTQPDTPDRKDPALFDALQQTLRAEGADKAIERLCTTLRERKDYGNLFYALLLKKRHELGITPLPTAPTQDVPANLQEAFENGIREAGRLVGGLYLEEGNIPQAWVYFRMLGEPGPVEEAINRYQPAEDEDCQPVIEVAFHQGVQPRKGFDLILKRFGICSAITMAGTMEFPGGPDVRTYCIQRLVRALYEELCQRLAGEIEGREGRAPEARSVRELLAGRDWLFEDEFAHIDVSHLGSVVQMSIHLDPCPEIGLARELCDYGRRLSARLQYPSDPPFEDTYRDYGVYLAALAGDDVEGAIAHFRAKAEEADPETVGSYPAEVLVNLLLRLDRPREALEVARRFLTATEGRPLSCPGIPELCQRTGDYQVLTEAAREQGDLVHFMAGLIAGGKGEA